MNTQRNLLEHVTSILSIGCYKGGEGVWKGLYLSWLGGLSSTPRVSGRGRCHMRYSATVYEWGNSLKVFSTCVRRSAGRVFFIREEAGFNQSIEITQMCLQITKHAPSTENIKHKTSIREVNVKYL